MLVNYFVPHLVKGLCACLCIVLLYLVKGSALHLLNFLTLETPLGIAQILFALV